MSENKSTEQVVEQVPRQVTEQVQEQVPRQVTEQVPEQVPEQVTEQVPEQIVIDAKNKLVEETKEYVDEAVDNIVNEALDKTLGDIELNENIGKMAGDAVSELTEGISKDLIDSVYIEVKDKLGDIGVKSSTLTIMIKYTIEAIENTPVKGKAQLDFAVRIIGDLINELENSEEKEFLLKTLKNGGIKDTIELVVDASKGKVNVNKVAETAASNFLMPCIEYVFGKCR